jgi:large subunit ribosomal protein L10
MSRAVKELVENRIREQYSGIENVLVVNVHGLTGVEANQLRGELRKKKIELHVVKNRAARRVLTGTALQPIESILKGPCAFVTGGASPVETAKELVRLATEYPKLELRLGVLDGEMQPIPIVDISKRRSKHEILGEVMLLATSPARRVAGCLNVGGRIAGCVKAIIDKLEKGETIAKVA